MAKVLVKDYLDNPEGEKKCGCGYRVSRIYYFDGDDPDKEGLCCICFCELIEEFGYQVFRPNQKFEILINKLLQA